MNILVVGCGQVGLHLVRQLEDAGHEVSVLDESAERLHQLDQLEGGPFSGVALVGMPIDVDVLRQAGIEACDAVAAVSDDDRINIMAAQIAQSVFGIRKVITRIADPRLEEIYAGQFGLETICPTRLTVGAALAALESEPPAAQPVQGTAAATTAQPAQAANGTGADSARTAQAVNDTGATTAQPAQASPRAGNAQKRKKASGRGRA